MDERAQVSVTRPTSPQGSLHSPRVARASPQSSGGERGEDVGSVGNRDEKPGSVADDFGEAAFGLVPVEAIGREAGELDTLFSADERTLDGQWVMAFQCERFCHSQ